MTKKVDKKRLRILSELHSKAKNEENLNVVDGVDPVNGYAAGAAARHNLSVGKMVVEGVLKRNTPVRIAAAASYAKFMDRDHVSMRIYDGVPDWVMFSTDWFSGLSFNVSSTREGGGAAMFYFGYLLRYGYWNGKGYLVMNKPYRIDIQRQLGITSNAHYMHMRWLIKWGVFRKPIMVGKNTYFSLNHLVVALSNEDGLKRIRWSEHTFKPNITFEEVVHPKSK